MTLKRKEKYSVSVSIDVNAGIEECWEVISDFNDVYVWAPSVVESHGITEAKRCVGAGRACDIKGFGKIDEYVTEWTEGRGFVYRVEPFGPFAGSHSRWHLTSLGAGRTRLEVSLTYNVKFGPLGAILNALMLGPKLRAALPDGLQAFKRRVETGELVRPYVTGSGLKAA